MTVSTLRPDSTTTSTGIAVTGASAHAALSDDSDSTYVDFSPGDLWRGTFTDLTLPAGAVINSVTVRLRASLDSAPGTPGTITSVVGIGPYTGSTALNRGLFINQPSTSPLTYTALTASVAGVTDPDADAVTASLLNGGSSGGPIRVYEAYLDIAYVTQPTVSADAPTGTITTSNLPLVEFTPTLDSAGGVHEVFEVKVYTDAQYGAGGFDPYTSTPTATSGISSAATAGAPATSWRLDETLPDDTYRAYVRVAQIVNGTYFWSEWDNTEFTVDVDLPGTPTFTATADNATGSITLQPLYVAGTATTDILEIQRSLDSGATWEPVRTLDGDGLMVLPYVAAVGEYSSAADGTTHNLVLPAPFGGIQADDMLVAVVAMDGNPSITWPAGWNEIKDEAGNGSAVRAGVAWKRADGGEVGTVAITTSASEGGGARILCVRGAHPTSAPEVSAGVSGSGANANPDLLDPAGWGADYTLYIAAMVNDGNVAVTAAGLGYLGFGNTRWANASGAGVATATLLSLGAEDPPAFTHAAEDTRAFTIGVRAENTSISLSDYEAPNGTTVQYRARALHDYNGEYAASDWATDSEAWTSGSWWLKHPNQPALNVAVTPSSMPTLSRAGRQGVFQPLGSTSAVVVSDTRTTATGEVTLRALTEAHQDDVDELLDTGDTLLLQSPSGQGGPDYIRVLGHSRSRIIDWYDATKTWEQLEFVKVDPPPGVVVEWP